MYPLAPSWVAVSKVLFPSGSRPAPAAGAGIMTARTASASTSVLRRTLFLLVHLLPVPLPPGRREHEGQQDDHQGYHGKAYVDDRIVGGLRLHLQLKAGGG